MKFLISVALFASLPSLLLSQDNSYFQQSEGAIIRGDKGKKEIALVFTGDEFADGGQFISGVLREKGIKSSFFFTGNFYRNPANELLIKTLVSDGHYLGPHSDRHLLYCDWNNRDSLLVDFDKFSSDINKNYKAMEQFGISRADARHFLPPFEWYNREISRWCDRTGLRLINFSPGTLSHADYTTPDMPNYRSSMEIFDSILNHDLKSDKGLNGFILLIHIGSSPARTDKFYLLLDELIDELTKRGYIFCRIDSLLE